MIKISGFFKLVMPVLSGFILTSCVTVGSSLKYQEPKPNSFTNNEVIVDRPFSAVWDALVGELAKSYFVINNVAKESRIINISYFVDNPEEYVDCGRLQRTYHMGEETRNYDYAVAKSNSFKTALAKWGGFRNLPADVTIKRKMTLEGRIDIYVAPKEAQTIVTANARYILKVQTSGIAQYYNASGIPWRTGQWPSSVNTVSFNTNQAGTADWGSIDQPIIVKCISNGGLEKEILDIVRNIN